MGYYKKILMLAQEGDRDAILTVANFCRDRGKLHTALFWYGQAHKTKEIAKIKALIASKKLEEEEDIFA
jgi:hypothetical protein